MGICSLADIDQVFLEISKALYGDAVDPRELWDLSKNTDAADVHIPAAGKPKKKKEHSNVARGLVLGAAAEGLGTYRAGEAAYHAIQPVKTASTAVKAGKLMSTGNKAAKVGEFGLQAANLGIGLIAARKLSQHAKKEPVGKLAPLKFLRPVKQVMSEAQATRHASAVEHANKSGVRLLAGTSAAAGALVGHHVGRKSGLKARDRDEPIGKALGTFRPINGVRAVNSGGLSPGLGRHGRMIGGKTPAPKLTPVAKPLPKAIIDNTVVKSLTWTGEISKVDTDKRTVFGWCSLSQVNGEKVVDLQGDYVPLDEVEKSAYRYVIESRKGGDMHKRISKDSQVHHTADLIESFVVTPDKLEQMGLAPDALPLGWWIGMKVNDDEQWAKVKSGERRAFSIHGTGSRTEMAA